MREVSNFLVEYNRSTVTTQFTMSGETWQCQLNRYHPLFNQPTAKAVEWFFNHTVPYASPALYGWELVNNA